MSDIIQTWLEQGAAGNGVLALAVRRPDRTLAVKSCHPEIPEPALVEVIQGIAEAVHLLQQHRMDAPFFCWTFETSQFRCAARPDGAIAIMLAGKDPAAAAAVDELLVQFLNAA